MSALGEATFALALEMAVTATKPPQVPLRQLHVLDNQLDNFLAEALKNAPVRCQPGCDRCCRQWLMGVEAYEVLRIAAHVQHMGTSAAVIDALALRVDAWDQLPPASDLERVRAYQRKNLPCPFLSSGECGIRTIRPYACRTYFSASDPALCGPEGLGDPRSRAFILEPHPEMGAALAALARPFERPHWTGEFLRDLLDALTNPEAPGPTDSPSGSDSLHTPPDRAAADIDR